MYRFDVKETQHVTRPYAVLDRRQSRYVNRFATKAEAFGRCCDLNRHDQGEQTGSRPVGRG